MYGAAMACALWKNGWASFGALAAISGDSQSRFLPSPRRLRHLENAISVLSGEAADVIGMEVRDQNEVDFFRRVARAAEAFRQAPEGSPTPPVPAPASTRISCLPVLTRKQLSTHPACADLRAVP